MEPSSIQNNNFFEGVSRRDTRIAKHRGLNNEQKTLNLKSLKPFSKQFFAKHLNSSLPQRGNTYLTFYKCVEQRPRRGRTKLNPRTEHRTPKQKTLNLKSLNPFSIQFLQEAGKNHSNGQWIFELVKPTGHVECRMAAQ